MSSTITNMPVGNKKLEHKIKDLSQFPERFKEIKLYLDLENADRTWEKYGTITPPVMVQDRFNNWTHHSGFKYWLYNDTPRKLLHKNHAVIPHEPIDAQLDQVIKDELVKNGLKLSIKETYSAHKGDTKYWTLLSDEVFYINEQDKQDGMKLGVVVRNGIGTNVALGIDLYSYRLVCSNGAVARGPQVGSLSLSHVGAQLERILQFFKDGIIYAFDKVRGFMDTYRKSSEINLNKEKANKIYKKLWDLGDIYFPDTFEIPDQKEIEKLRKSGEFWKRNDLVEYNPVGDGSTMWDFFNHVTAQYRDRLAAKKIAFPRVAEQQSRLHQVLIAAVNKTL